MDVPILTIFTFVSLCISSSWQADSTDFYITDESLLLVQDKTLLRINLKSDNSDFLPARRLKSAVSVEFDTKINCVFWADDVTKNIERQCIDGSHVTLVTNCGLYGRIAYDWVSHILYYVSYSHSLIGAVSVTDDAPIRWHRTIVQMESDSRPMGLAVHPKRGYIFWTSRKETKPQIQRANMDGSDVRVLFQHPQVDWPETITIDHAEDRIYWVDLNLRNIQRSDCNGNNVETVIQFSGMMTTPFAVAIYHNEIYWNDRNSTSVYKMSIANRDQLGQPFEVAQLGSAGVSIVSSRFVHDIKVIAESIRAEMNGCSGNAHRCEYICVGAPGDGYSCLCPTGMALNADGKCVCSGLRVHADGTCREDDPEEGCDHFSRFRCANRGCVPAFYRCDDDDDCGDGSDETGCTPCPTSFIQCQSDGRCIREGLKCDHSIDCGDGSDELDCGTDWILELDAPIVGNLTYDAQRSMLQWSASKSPHLMTKYEIEYGETDTEFTAETVSSEVGLEYKLDLTPCRKYLVRVEATVDDSIERERGGRLRIKTAYDPREAPSHVHHFIDGTAMIFTWEHSCPFKNEHPSYYLFTVHDLVLNKSTTRQVRKLWYRYDKIPKGAAYNFTISTPADGAEAFTWSYNAPPLPTPIYLHADSQPNGYVLEWEKIDFDEAEFDYELVITNPTSSKSSSIRTKKNVFIVESDMLAELGDNASFVTAGVRIKTVAGYTSTINASAQLNVLSDDV